MSAITTRRETPDLAKPAGKPATKARRRPFANRPDSEHEMVLNRIVFGALIFGYLALSAWWSREGAAQPLVISSLYLLGGLGFLAHIIWRPGSSPIRRVAAMIVDLGTLSYVLYLGGEVTAILYPIYLWVIFGNGFRFGIPYLFGAVAVSVTGFTIVSLTDSYWSEHPPLWIGLLVGLVLIPAYASTLIRKLSRAKQEAEEANRQKSLFLASVSHELRTPLNAIIGLSDLLKDTPLDSNQRGMAETIQTAGSTLLDHINDILDFSRLEAGKMPTEIAAFDLHALVRESVLMVTAQAGAKGLHAGYHIDPATPARVKGPRRHLQEILVNLAGNAVKFTREGYVHVDLRVVEDAQSRIRLRFAVTDTGIGIAPAARERIFESFTQADETIIDSFGGTGLGLAIVKQLVLLNGGEIGVDSEPGAGSVFWFEFVVDPAAPSAAEDETAKAFAQIPAPLLLTRAADAPALAAHFLEHGVAARLVGSPGEAAEIAARDVAGDRPAPALIIDVEHCGLAPEEIAAACAAGEGLRDHAAILMTPEPEEASIEARLGFATTIARYPEGAALAGALRVAATPYLRSTDGEDAQGRSAAPSLPPLRVLVAEDNLTNQKVIAKILERAGHEPVIVDHGRAALERLLAERFDVVLMDVNMPEMNGVEATRAYCEAVPEAERAPVIALTADVTPEGRAACLDSGMAACVGKPILPARLFAVVREVLVASGRDLPEVAAAPEFDGAEREHERASAPRQAVDDETLSRLEQLGGAGFRAEVARAFLSDAKTILRELEEAVARDDDEAFRDLVHALRSSAANVGAVAIFEMCLALREIGAEDMRLHGVRHARELTARFEEARGVLEQFAEAA
ncbi:MAG: response regulator [Salinarimonadaceae bacterium]|nr:MAG: response regulator [Salinarimonadaceae bacterium]